MLVLRLERILSKDQGATHQIYEAASKELEQSQVQYSKPQQLYDEIYFSDQLVGYNREHYLLKHKLACYEASVHQSVHKLGAIREPFCVGYYPLDEESQNIICSYNYQGIHGKRIPISQRAWPSVKRSFFDMANVPQSVSPINTYVAEQILWAQWYETASAKSGDECINGIF